jgi:uncharacterized protein
VVSLSGAHAYGFPSPDSDLDLKAIHIDLTSRLVGLSPIGRASDRLEVIEGVEIDYSSNEIGPVLLGALLGNGNYLERILSAIPLRSSPEHEQLRPLLQRTVSKRIHRHYNGFARGQLHDFEVTPKAKKMLYVLRTTLTGVHGLLTGEIVTDVTQLLDRYGFSEARELIERKRAGELVELSPELRDKWRREIGRAFSLLDESRVKSPLPDEPTNRDELDAWLLEIRRRYF